MTVLFIHPPIWVTATYLIAVLWPFVALLLLRKGRTSSAVTAAALVPAGLTAGVMTLYLAALDSPDGGAAYRAAFAAEAMMLPLVGAFASIAVFALAACKRHWPSADRVTLALAMVIAAVFGAAVHLHSGTVAGAVVALLATVALVVWCVMVNGEFVSPRPVRFGMVAVLLALLAMLSIARNQAYELRRLSVVIASPQMEDPLADLFIHPAHLVVPFLFVWPFLCLLLVRRRTASSQVTFAALVPLALTAAEVWLNLANVRWFLGPASWQSWVPGEIDEAMFAVRPSLLCAALVILFSAVKRSRPALDRNAIVLCCALVVIAAGAYLFARRIGGADIRIAYAGAMAGASVALLALGGALHDRLLHGRPGDMMRGHGRS